MTRVVVLMLLHFWLGGWAGACVCVVVRVYVQVLWHHNAGGPSGLFPYFGGDGRVGLRHCSGHSHGTGSKPCVRVRRTNRLQPGPCGHQCWRILLRLQQLAG